MSTGVTTLIAALSGLLGATIGGLLAGRQQRSAQLRDRMLDVALDYVEALREAVSGAPVEPMPEDPVAKDALERAYRLSHRAMLLFGPDSPAGEQAVEAYFDTLQAFDHAQEPLDIDERIEDGAARATQIWTADHEEVEGQAERTVDRFAVLAGRAIRSGSRHPWLDHGRRVRRWLFQSPSRRRAMRELREVGGQYRVVSKQLKTADAEYRRVLDEAEAEGISIPRELSEPPLPRDPSKGQVAASDAAREST